MKVLWVPQLSSVDAETGRFKLSSDSNWVFGRSVINMLIKFGFEFNILIPYECINEAKKDLDNSNVNYYIFEFMRNAIGARYNFNMHEAIATIRHINPDIFWINDPGQVMNWKIAAKLIDINFNKVKFISYNHWLDSDFYAKIDENLIKRNVSYTMRQLEGLFYSDLFFVNSDFAKEMIKDQLSDICFDFEKFDGYYKFLMRKVQKLPPFIINDDFIKRYKISEKKENNILTIIYNHRISTFPYYLQALERFCYICDELIKKEIDLKVILTNPSGKKLPIERNYFIVKNNLTYEEYMHTIQNSDIAIGTFLPGNGGMWSISLCETLIWGIPTFIPRHSGYAEIVPDNCYYGYYSDNNDLFNKIVMLIEDRKLYDFVSNYKDIVIKEYHENNIGKKLNRMIRRLF